MAKKSDTTIGAPGFLRLNRAGKDQCVAHPSGMGLPGHGDLDIAHHVAKRLGSRGFKPVAQRLSADKGLTIHQ